MMDFTLDHVVIAVRDLAAATADYMALLGRKPSWRGQHPTYGTENTLFRLDNTYLELLAPSASRPKDKRWREALGRTLDERGEGPYALALGTTDIKRATKDLRHNGLDIDDPRDGEGVDLETGARRAWRNALVSPRAANGVRLFFIEHTSPADALPFAERLAGADACVTRMDHAVLLSADLEASRRFWSDRIEARLALDRTFPDRNTRILFYRLGDITIEMSGGAQQAEEGIGKPDRLWGLAWGVGDVEAMCRRLADEGIETGGPRPGIKPGTNVATAKGPRTHGVATLLIEHTAESFEPESRAPRGAAFDNTRERRAFTVTGLDRIIIAGDDVDGTSRKWARTLDARPAGDASDARALRSEIDAGNAIIQLLQPLRAEPDLAAIVDARGQGMLALAVRVDDLARAVADLRAKAVTVAGPAPSPLTGRWAAQIDRSATHGVPIELVERP